jgi:serine/threonine-protein kinase
VTFLAQEELIEKEEAEEILAPGKGLALRTDGENRLALRQIMSVQAALLVAIIVCSGFLRFAYPATESSQPHNPTPAITASLEEAGFLRVVAQPWAHVFVDGQQVATTPTARRFPLAPGRHFVRLENPYFQTHEEEITIRTGATITVQVELSRAQGEE